MDKVLVYVENPSIICPDDIEEYTDPGEDTAVVTWSQPNATDNSGSVNVTSNYQQGSNFVIGSTVVYYNASDPYGNVDSCLFTVTVIDDEPPTILCPDNIDVAPEPGEATVVVNWTQPNATDNSGYVTVTSDYESGTEFSIGSTSIHYNASDPSGNMDSCRFNVTVGDVVNPEIICPGNIEVVTDAGQATAVVTWTSPNATDNSGSVTLSSNYQPGAEFAIGSTIISYNATDPFGNVDSCNFNVTVTDVENPSIICPYDIEEYTGLGEDTAVVTWSQPNATDNSGSVNVTSNYQQGSNFVIGSTVVYYNASDPYGNVDSCLFTVTVIDDEPPTILCPDNIDVAPEPGEATVVVNWTQPNATDNSGYVTVTSDYESGTEFSIGSTSIRYNASDPSGNVDSCQFNLTVQDAEDLVIIIIIICPDAIVVSTDPGLSTALVNWTDPVTNVSSGSVTVTSNYQPGTEFAMGTTIVYYNASDSLGNMDSCNFTVTVIDDEPPTILCPDNIDVAPEPGEATVVVNWTQPYATDNSGYVTVKSDYQSGTEFSIGSTSIHYNASDPSGNVDSCQFNLTVQDAEDAIIIIIIICPDAIEVSTDPGLSTALVNWTDPVTNVSSGSVTVTSNYQPGTEFAMGTTIVYYNASDSLGNMDSCNFTVTVTDDEPPTILCPDNIDVAPEPGEATVVVNWTQPIANDNSGYVTVTSDYESGTEFSIGFTNVNYNASDTSGNMASCHFNVTVTDIQSLSIVCPDDIEVNTDPGEAIALVNWTDPSTAGSSGSVAITSDYQPGTEFAIGTTIVFYNASDFIGNMASCHFNVTVIDDENPSIFCPDDIEANTDPGELATYVNWTQPDATDNSGSVNVTSNHQPGTEFSIGFTLIIYVASDPSGNEVSCHFNLSIIGTAEESTTKSRTTVDTTEEQSTESSSTTMTTEGPTTAIDSTIMTTEELITISTSEGPTTELPTTINTTEKTTTLQPTTINTSDETTTKYETTFSTTQEPTTLTNTTISTTEEPTTLLNTTISTTKEPSTLPNTTISTTVEPTTPQPTTISTTEELTTLPPTTISTTEVPTTLPKSTISTTEEPSTKPETTLSTTEVPTTLPNSTISTTEEPTTKPETTFSTTEVPNTLPNTTIWTTEEPTTKPPTTISTTEEPTTKPPTTISTTEEPTTKPPTTISTTEEPTTKPPTTISTTEEPTTKPPTTISTTEEPTTKPPTTISTTEEPTTKPPTTISTTEEPTTKPPTTISTTEEPTTKPPTTISTTEEPTTKPPTTISTTEEPTTKPPTTISTTDEPTTKPPTTISTTEEPTTKPPTTISTTEEPTTKPQPQ
ncbi:hyalin-like [Ptychodera flava]|uniref:hyalin-like n=1 Tax=Ptychodera flava TaxID=63121 RepID=UPI00396A7BA7